MCVLPVLINILSTLTLIGSHVQTLFLMIEIECLNLTKPIRVAE